jgi:hypothetical protein
VPFPGFCRVRSADRLLIDRIEPTVRRSPMPHTPFDLEPDEFPMAGDIPMILATRREKKLKKAEARRDVRRREVEKLRA